MEPFILALLLVGVLIAGGVAVSLYLYTSGAVGARRSRYSRSLAFATESAIEGTAAEDDFDMNMSTMYGATSRFTRHALIAALTVIGSVVLLLALMVNSMAH